MDQLTNAKLFGTDLIEVSSPVLIKRYLASMEQLGLTITKLPRFHIDALGWSPEIAQELNNEEYLSAGECNPLGIIITPDQRLREIYAPSGTIEIAALRQYFSQHRQEIADVTTTHSIHLDFDPGISKFEHPRDLLQLDQITVRSAVVGLSDAALKQRELLTQFYAEGLEWFEPSLRKQIIDSAREIGDLRKRRLEIPGMRFSLSGSFYSPAFGGVYVLRSADSEQALVVLVDEENIAQRRAGQKSMYGISDENLVRRLFERGLVAVDLNWYRENIGVAERKRRFLVGEVIATLEPGLDLRSLTATQCKQILAKHSEAVPDLLNELDMLVSQLRRGAPPPLRLVSPELQRILMHPASELSVAEQQALSRLICEIQPLDLVQLYQASRRFFIERYRSWPELKRSWAVKMLLEYKVNIE